MSTQYESLQAATQYSDVFRVAAPAQPTGRSIWPRQPGVFICQSASVPVAAKATPGAEPDVAADEALQGAQGHIKNGHPILAIAVYHTVSDFWRIPEYVLSLRPDYRIFLRHYTEGWSETVMYFIPAAPAPA